MVKGGTKSKLSIEKPNSLLSGEIAKNRMVKKGGGTKKKIPIEKIQKKDSLRVTFTKRRDGLFSKASQLCLLSGSQVAILATPPSSESNVSFFSFGHSSVDGLVSAFLTGQRPVPAPAPEDNKQSREDVGICLTRKDIGLGFWWEDESLAKSESPEELRDAMDSMSTLLSNLKELNTVNDNRRDHHPDQAFVNDDEDLKKKKNDVVILHNGTQEPDQTLNLQSTFSVDGDLPANFNDITEEQDQILTICDTFCVMDNNNNNAALPEVNLDYNQEMDIDQLIDFNSNFESALDDWFSKNGLQELEGTTASLLTSAEAVDDVSIEKTNPNLCSDSQDIEDGNLVHQRCLVEDDLRFSDFFNDFTTIAR